ncbi:MAG: SDR family oxidoreductase [Rhizobiales bacterium]|nr:SDR family oxidoreductase [Hyphomicrobiales bacterium]
MDLGLKDKTALVLGAGGGLGRAIALALAQEGARLALGDIDGGALEETRREVAALGSDAMAIRWDLADLDAIDQNVGAIETQLGPADVLVNNTGGPPPTPALGQSADLWRKHFEAMVLSCITLSDRVVPGMRARKWGRVITSASSGVVAPIPNLAVSNALRLSLVGWSKTLAREIGRDGVTANVIVPGRIATKRIVALDQAKAVREARSVEQVSTESTAAIAIGRYGDPREYGASVAFLASTQASYITGSVVRIDGGLIASI